MSERKVNLEDILTSFELNEYCLIESERSVALKAMKEACKQTLELAAENSEINKNGCCEDEEFDCSAEINKQSILSTINQVE